MTQTTSGKEIKKNERNTRAAILEFLEKRLVTYGNDSNKGTLRLGTRTYEFRVHVGADATGQYLEAILADVRVTA